MVSIDASFLSELNTSLQLFKPELMLVVTFLVALIADLVFRKSKNVSGYVALAGFIVTAVLLIGRFEYLCGCSGQAIAGKGLFSFMVAVDPFSEFFKFIILLCSFVVVLMSFCSKELYDNSKRLGEYFTLIIGMTFGMFLLTSAGNFIMIYLAIETMSLSSYVLAGYTKQIKRASEASLKYVIFGGLSSGIMIYGISILYGLTGTLDLYDLNKILMFNQVNVVALSIAGLMIIAGIGYKISAVPFHFWTPDVYEGAPVTITAFLSVASKAAGFAVLIRFVTVGFVDPNAIAIAGMGTTLLGGVDWKFVIAILSVLSMTLGNIVALWQSNVKRMLAYSSIAHAGYMLMGVVVMSDTGVMAVMIYFFVYLLMNLGAFFVVELIANKIGSEDLEDYVGLGYRSPALGVTMTIFLISLTGIPPTAGFIGKFFLFTSLLEANMIWLAVVGVLNSVVSLVYYMKVLRNMWIRGLDNVAEPMEFPAGNYILLYALAAATLIFGIWYTPIAKWAESSVAMLLGN